jgi:fatty acid desaturase
MTTNAPRPASITWYRTPLESKDMKELHRRSDLLGALQTLSYLAVITSTGCATLWAASHGSVGLVLALLFLHGTVCAFFPNAVHELGHGTVFKTKALNALFVRVFAFLGWNNFESFNVSHARHHRYTLHAPDDLEVVLPMKILVRHFFLYGFVNLLAPWQVLKNTVRMACGRFEGQWELTLFPEGSPERKAPVRWARTLLIGHALIIFVSACLHLWSVPVLTTFCSFYGGWLFFLCNSTQHIGLQDDVPDFRLCCRTFTINPVVQFLYWHMNYHTEHHMYAAVPCYRLGRLHELIKYDLPPCPHGLVATWLEIAAIQKIQESDPNYQFQAALPSAAESAMAAMTYK